MGAHTCTHLVWAKSPEWRAIARAAILKHHAERHLLPKCGAKRKSTGTPCQSLPAKGRTRCRLHGGATPCGSGPAGWHTPGFPLGLGMPTGKARSDAQKRRRAFATIARVEEMSPDERARYVAWQASHKPGSATARARRRADRKAAQWLQDLMAGKGLEPKAPRQRKAKPPTLRRALREGLGVFG
ncbi:HGGxSTG domain-containing protein [Methylobacterium soli]|uniref:Uncharacterized protein n=1 Tax=Methylobacterium soli TaxID=553447 RepID=A0A6L3SYW8_9HYPH|nr:HGGxSTG domain-containing protein [Methylobacterium soli]KAB1075393.1 hypothetical protein F6X53_24805 [Methylobacterium soli]GJE43782.1 hypothetical protein AEGHOMDF_2961 [Methylobacterium soli]